jgi:Predicted nucleic-acid-binding protein containing a Zn-ribbon
MSVIQPLRPKEVSGLFVFPGKWEIEYEYAAGRVLTEFFKKLKEGKIVGSRCPSCKRVLMPPRAFCERCMVETSELVEVKDEGSC